jgi:hypothetical protein
MSAWFGLRCLSRHILRSGVGALLAAGLVTAGGVPASAQTPSAQTPQPDQIHPIDVHSGTCLDPVPDPVYDFGELEPIPATGEPGELAEQPTDVFGDDGVLSQDDPGFLEFDADNDGIFDIGIDANQDDVLDENEVVGTDTNQDRQLTPDEVTQDLQQAEGVAGLTQAWKVDTTVDVSGEQLLNEGPYVLIVHASEENYPSYLACGEIGGFAEENQLVVPLRPVGESDFFGVALIEIGAAEYAAYLFSPIVVEEVPTQAQATPTS